MSGGVLTARRGSAGPRSHPAAGTRILAVGNMYPPHHAGGYELAWQAAMRHARELGHEVRVLTSDYRKATSVPDEPGVHRTLRWYWDLDRYEFPRLTVLERLRIERHNAAELSRQLATFRPDVVSWWSMGCMSLGLIEQVRRAGLPATFVVHDDWLVYGAHYDQWTRMWTGRRRALAAAAERLTGIPTRVELDGAGAFVFNSSYTRERALETGLRAPRNRVVHPGIDERFLAAEPARPWRWHLVYVGRIDRQKGIDTALRAMAHLPAEASLSIWGTGDDAYVTEMRELSAHLGIAGRVRFEGWAETEQLPQLYAGADVVVFPVRWHEPFGLVPLEAMGMGRPLVTTARGGTREFVRDGENALVFEPDDRFGLARAIRRLGADEGLRDHLRAGAIRTAAAYTTSRFARDTVDEIVRAAHGGAR